MHAVTLRAATTRILCGVFCVGLLACKAEELQVSALQPVTVLSTRVEAAPKRSISTRGWVRAAAPLRVSFELAGRVSQVYVREGQHVRAGELLARLSEVQARRQWRVARTSMSVAQRAAQRAASLNGVGALAASGLEDAEDRLALAHDSEELARTQLELSSLRAPRDGVVRERLIEPEEVVAPGMPVLVLETDGDLELQVELPYRSWKALPRDASALVRASERAPFSVPISSVASAPAANGLYTVVLGQGEAAFKQLGAGSYAEVEIPLPTRNDLVLIPVSALVHRGVDDVVFELSQVAGHLVARKRNVHVLESVEHGLILDDGLTAKSEIVAEGSYFLRDGEPVRVLETPDG